MLSLKRSHLKETSHLAEAEMDSSTEAQAVVKSQETTNTHETVTTLFGDITVDIYTCAENTQNRVPFYCLRLKTRDL